MIEKIYTVQFDKKKRINKIRYVSEMKVYYSPIYRAVLRHSEDSRHRICPPYTDMVDI